MAESFSKTGGLTRGNLITIFLVALAARLLNVATIDDFTVYAFAGDSPIYWNGAQAWLEAGYFARHDGVGYVVETERVPLYNLFLLPIRWAFGDSVWQAVVLQSTLDSLTCVLVAMLGGQFTRMTGLLAGFLAAFWPNLIINSQLILGDSLFLFFFTGILYFASRYLRTAKFLHAVSVGLLCGCAIMTRSVALYIPVAMALCAPFVSQKVLGKWRSGILAGFAIILGSLIIASPLLWRNVTQFGSFQLTAQGGTHFLNWVVGYVNSLDRGTTFTFEARRIRERQESQALQQKRIVDASNPFAIAASEVEFARQELQKIPLQSIVKAWVYGAALNLGTPAIVMDPRIQIYNQKSLMNSTGATLTGRLWAFFKGNHPTYLFWVVVGLVASSICAVLQFSGWLLLLRKSVWPGLFAGLAIVYFLLATGPVGAPKYRLPFEPILIVLQSITLLSLRNHFWRTRNS